VILVDAGPLVAVIDEDEANHARCVAALAQAMSPPLTTWPAFTEAMYLLGQAAGWRGQELLWRLVTRGDLELAEISAEARVSPHSLIVPFGRAQGKPTDAACSGGRE
jgi:uncharacterized protein with PIN domain